MIDPSRSQERVADDTDVQQDSVGVWAKTFYYSARTMIESILRRYDLGPTQWYVLRRLADNGPTMQRDLGRMLKVERATLSEIVAALVRKGLVDQVPDAHDQRQRVVRLTTAGAELWKELPDPIARTHAVAFSGADSTELATALRVLQAATQRLNDHLSPGDDTGHRTRAAPAPRSSAAPPAE